MESLRRGESDHAPHLELLAEPLRRRVLEYLMQSSTDQATIDELVDYLVDDRATAREADPRRIRIRLHHCDLRILADSGVITYGPRNGDVRYLPNDRIEAE